LKSIKALECGVANGCAETSENDLHPVPVETKSLKSFL